MHTLDCGHASLRERVRWMDDLSARDSFLRIVRVGEPDEVLGYAQLIERADRFRAGYETFLRPRERVVLLLRHSSDLYAAILGAVLGGFVPTVFAHPSIKFSKAAYCETIHQLLRSASARLVVADPDLEFDLRSSPHETLQKVQLTHPEALLARPLRSQPNPAATGVAPPSQAEPAPAFLQFSSGTTGLKKGVPVADRELLWQVETYAAELALSADDVIVSWLPLYHDMGLICCYWLPS